jgi:MFS family permease
MHTSINRFVAPRDRLSSLHFSRQLTKICPARPRKLSVPLNVAAEFSKSSSSPFSFGAVKDLVSSLFNVFPHDAAANRRLLVLVVGQALCSVATLIHDSYLPVYAQDVLGLTNTSIGAVQGLAQFLTQVSKGVSGIAGDVLGSQVGVLAFGTLMTFLCKPCFVLLSTVHHLAGPLICLYFFFFAKLLDRMSKGIREAPSKAVINELAREAGESPDAAYGLRQSLATAGALAGSGVASLTFWLTGQSFEATFTVAMVPPFLALIWIVSNFREELFGKKIDHSPPLDPAPSNSISSVSIASVDNPIQEPPAKEISLGLFEKASLLFGSFKPAYWQALIVISILYMARFDASFLSLRAKETSMPKTLLPMIALISSACQVLLTAPLSRWAGGSVSQRNKLLLIGFCAMVITNAFFALTSSATGMFAGAFFLGLHMAATHSITISMVAAYMPTGYIAGLGKLSGTAVSVTDLALGFVLAASNTAAGVLSDMTRAAGWGNIGCFFGGASASVLAALALILFDRFGDLGKDELIVRKKRV